MKKIIKNILRVCLIIVKNEAFNVKILRNIRWFIFRKLYSNSNFYVDKMVDIHRAHKSKESKIKISNNVHLGAYCYIDYSGGVEIRENTSISENVQIFTHNHIIDGDKNWHNNPISFSALVIEKNCWIGAGAIILPSVKLIREGSIIGAGSVCTKDTESYFVYAGNPCSKIKKRKC